MLDRRGLILAPSDRGFLESIIDDSDLIPIRYLALGQIVAAAVSRIFLQAHDVKGSGIASAFPVTPGSS